MAMKSLNLKIEWAGSGSPGRYDRFAAMDLGRYDEQVVAHVCYEPILSAHVKHSPQPPQPLWIEVEMSTEKVIYNPHNPTRWIVPVKVDVLIRQLDAERLKVHNDFDGIEHEINDLNRIGQDLQFQVRVNADNGAQNPLGPQRFYIAIVEADDTQRRATPHDVNIVPGVVNQRLNTANSRYAQLKQRMDYLENEARLLALAPQDHVLLIDAEKAAQLNFAVPDLP